jgi:membrane protein DedA with SNARE-associated domain
MILEKLAVQKLIIIFLIGMVGINKAVPAGVLLKISPVLIYLMTVLGAGIAVILIYIFGNRIKERILKKENRKRLNKKKSRLKLLFDKYGSIGFALFGIMSMGPTITALMGLIIVNDQRKLLLWIIIGIVIWTTFLTVVAAVSINLLNKFTSIKLFS